MRGRNPGEFPPVTGEYRPANYLHDLSRGTVEYNETWQNYAYHSVTVPAGTVIRNANFAQAVPRTQALIVVGVGGIVLEGCNLTNCAVQPDWTLITCNTTQSWIVLATEPDTGVQFEDRRTIAGHPDLLPVILDVPADAILAREN